MELFRQETPVGDLYVNTNKFLKTSAAICINYSDENVFSVTFLKNKTMCER
jgi:hypothetical protein